MKVLVCIPWFTPAFRAGGPIRSIENLVKQDQSNRKYFIFCGNTDVNGEHIEVKRGEWLSFNERTKVFYAESERRSETLVKETEKIKPDAIFINGLYSWHFNVVPLFFCKAPRKIVSPRGMLNHGALGQKVLKKKLFFFLWKMFGAQHRAVFHATSKEEAQMIESFFDEEVKIKLAKNYPALNQAMPAVEKEPGSLKMVTVALISPMKNHLLVLESLLNCKYKVEYHIIGAVKDQNYWSRCKDLILRLPVNVVVRYDGELPHNEVSEALANAHIFILPSESENFGHALAEALSAGRPVITSRNTPWNGLEDARAGINASLNTGDLARGIDKFAEMQDSELRQWSTAASSFVSQAIDLEEIHEQYKKLFENNGD